MEFKAVATCGFGLEAITAFELRKMGISELAVSDGRINFSCGGFAVADANIRLRTAERVLLVLAEFDAASFDELFDGVYSIPWSDFIGRSDAFPVKGYTMNSALTSVPACQSIAKKAAVKRLQSDYGTQFLTEKSGITKRIQFSIVKDRCTVMLDTSGDGLHKRGYRPLLNEAPIKETLAAGIADLARIKGDSAVCDPFCGSGTLLIESALRALNIAPGLNRAFAGEQYSFLGDNAFKEAKERARAEIDRTVSFSARGIDIDPEAVVLAKRNAERAGVADRIEFSAEDAREFSPHKDEIIIANPPYGERLMSEREVERLYSDFGKNLSEKSFKGLYLISGHPEFERTFGKKANKRRKLYNGMIPCQLFMYFE